MRLADFRSLLTKTVLVVGLTLLLCPAGPASGAEFTEGNLIVTHDFSTYGLLREYTRTGTLVQTIPIPKPAFGDRETGDAAWDLQGRVHVINNGFYSDDPHFLSTYDPATNSWSHHSILGVFGNVSDGDIAILDNNAYTRNQVISLDDFSTVDIPQRPRLGNAEVVVGRDGLLYIMHGGSPRPTVDVVDPADLNTILRTLTLRDSSGLRLDARGLAVTDDGSRLFAADWNGVIYEFDQDAAYVRELDTPAFNLNNIDLAPDGTLVVGSRPGQVVLTDVDFSFLSSFVAASVDVYVAHVAPPVQSPVPTAFRKELVDGPDEDGDGVIDRVVEAGGRSPIEYTFKITFLQPESVPALVRDVVPPRWELVDQTPDSELDLVTPYPGTGKIANARETVIDWLPDGNDGCLTCTIQTRQLQGTHVPRRCGALWINAGATALESTGQSPLLDGDGNPLTTDGICIAVVEDANGDGMIDYTGNGDEDGDGLTDYEEACVLGTNPCDADTDGDRVSDNVDPDPLDRKVR